MSHSWVTDATGYDSVRMAAPLRPGGELTACFPLAVVAPLVEIVAAIRSSALTASKSNTPPEDNFRRSLRNG